MSKKSRPKPEFKLNLGCGKDVREGYENIDIRDLPGTIKADVRDLPYPEGSCDEILAMDILEHISHEETLATVAHWLSKLKSGGVLKIQSPCLPMICAYIMSSSNPDQIHNGIKLLFGNQDYADNTHRTALHPELFHRMLVMDLCVPEENIAFNTEFGTNVRVLIKKP